MAEEYFVSDALIAQLMRQEKFEAKPYYCSAHHMTIGYGHNMDARSVPGIGLDSVINQDQARRLLHNDAQFFGSELLEEYPWMWDMPAVRFEVFVNMAFNMGLAGFGKFHETLAAAQSGDYTRTAAEMLDSDWAKQVGDYAPDSDKGRRLGRAGRAWELAQQMRTGRRL